MIDSPPTIRMLYDGLCPLCAREVAFLKRRNHAGAVEFEDIADPGFDPGKYGLSMDDVIGSMHAVRADGTVLKGLDVFAEVYRHCGLKWLASIIEFPATRPMFSLGYRAFASVRPKFSKLDAAACRERCAMPR